MDTVAEWNETSESREIEHNLAPVDTPSHEAIARLAYVLWEMRGGEHGSAEQDWYEAERKLGV